MTRMMHRIRSWSRNSRKANLEEKPEKAGMSIRTVKNRETVKLQIAADKEKAG